MCDPLVGGLIAGAASIASAGMQYAQSEAVQSAQQNANDQWVAYQNQIHKQEALAQDAARNKANTAREQTLQNFTPQNQETMQSAESQRLNTAYTKAGDVGTVDPTQASNDLLSGESSGNKTFMNSLTQQVNQATSQARGRIAALATANSYGGSFGGLGTVDPILFQQGGNQINLQNAIRQGDIQTYGVQQQVQPIQYALGPNFNAMGTIGQGLAKIAGTGLGTAGAGALAGWGGGSGGGVASADTTDWSGAVGTPDFSYIPDDAFNNSWA